MPLADPDKQNTNTTGGNSQWVLVWREFRKRKLAVFSLLLIVFLVTLSIFAPFIANGKPIYYYGFNRFQYEDSRRTVFSILTSTHREIQELKSVATSTTPNGKDRSSSSPEKKIISTKTTIDLQVAAMSKYLDTEKSQQLNEWLTETKQQLDELLTNIDTKQKALKAQIIALNRDFSASKVQLQSHSHWPVFTALTPLDYGFICFNVILLLLPIWLLILQYTVRPALRFPVSMLLLFIIPVFAGLLGWLTITPTNDRTDYKNGVLYSDLDEAPRPYNVAYQSVLWPVIPFSLDEIDLNNNKKPPEILPADYWLQEDALDAYRADEQEQAEQQSGRLVSAPHYLGTDGLGRDMLTRMIWGGRVSLSVGIVAVSIYVTIGIIVGAIAGYFGGTTDLLISRFIEMVICFPSFFLILTIVAFVGPSIFNIMIVIGLIGWTGVARLVRGEFLRLSNQEFVLAGRALGYSPPRLIFRHILPNALAPVLVSATFGIAGAILTESALSFLGFGVTVPTPSWGSILQTGRESIFSAPWIIYFPGLAIFLTITAYNLVGETLRDASDPRLRGKLGSH